MANIRYTSDAEDIIREATDWLIEEIKELKAEKEADQDTIAAYKEENERLDSMLQESREEVKDLQEELAHYDVRDKNDR